MKKILLWCMAVFSTGISAQTTATIGAGASTTTGASNGDPIYRSSSTSSFHYSRSVQLISATDLATAGIPIGANLSSIAFFKANGTTISGANAFNLKVSLKNSNSSELSAGVDWTTMTTGAVLFSSSTYNSANNLPSAAGWVNFNNNTSNTFTYTGGSIEVYLDWTASGTMASPFTGGSFLWKYDTSTLKQAIGTSNSAVISDTYSAYTTQLRKFQTQLTYTASPCTGTPSPGNTISSNQPVCAGAYNTTLSIQNQSSGSGLVYQWYKNNVAISGATSSSFQTLITAADTYYCTVTCGGSTFSGSSTPLTVAAPINGISTLPWSENFDALTTIGANILPSCWLSKGGGSSFNTHYTSANASSNTYNDPKSAPNYITIYYPTTNAAYLWTPNFQLNAGTSYSFSFNFVGDNTTGWDNKVLVNNSQSDIGATILTTFISPSQTAIGGSNSTNYTKVLVTFVPSTTGGYHFGIKSSATTTAPNYMGYDDFTLELTPSCSEPTNLTSNNITPTTAEITWVATGNNFEYFYSTTNTPPSGTTIPSGSSTTNTANLTNLSAATTYYFWVRKVCSSTEKSVWSSIGFFTTACAAIEPFYTNDFSTFPGNCWTSAASGGDPTTGPTGTSGLWIADGFLNSGTTGAAKINLYSSGRKGWLITNTFNLSAGNYRIKMNLGVTAWGLTDPSPMGSDDEVRLLISNDGGTTWTTLYTWNSVNAPLNVNTPFSLDIPTYVSPNTKFALYGTDGNIDNSEDYDFFVDNFTVETITLSTTENIVKHNVNVYPNPFSDVLTISNVKEVKSISVIDLSGKIVKTFANPSATLQLGGLTSGMYLVVLTMKNGMQQTIKTIKK